MGIPTLIANQKIINQQFKQIKAHVSCPLCNSGFLSLKVIDNQKDESGLSADSTCYRWRCESCDWYVDGPQNQKQLQQAILPICYKIGQQRLNSLSIEERAAIEKGHYAKAKTLLMVCFILLIVTIYFAITKAMFFMTLQWIIVLLFVFSFALRAGFRGWQIHTGYIYLKQSPFFYWLQNESWFSPPTDIPPLSNILPEDDSDDSIDADSNMVPSFIQGTPSLYVVLTSNAQPAEQQVEGLVIVMPDAPRTTAHAVLKALGLPHRHDGRVVLQNAIDALEANQFLAVSIVEQENGK